MPVAHPQTFVTPPPPHVRPAGQAPPQVTVPLPHPLGMVPQFFPAGHAVSGAQQVLGLGPAAGSQTDMAAGHIAPKPQSVACVPPQMASVELTVPQFLPRRMQKA